MKKQAAIVTLAAALTLGSAITAYAGWESDENGRWWYLNDSGSYARDQIMTIDGVNYGFDAEAYMMIGWQRFGSDWYYFNPSGGAMMTGWQMIDGTWYYLEPSTGVMRSGWLKVGPNLYYLDPDGKLKTDGYFDVDGLAYAADASGVILRNTSEQDENGNIFVYDDLGRIKIANSSTRTISKGEDGGSVYQDFLSLKEFENLKAELTQQADDVVAKTKDELYVKYKKRMQGAKTTNQINSRKAKWETSARYNLGQLPKVTEEEINLYIQQVEWNTYQPYGDLTDYGYDEIDPNYEYNDEDEEDEDDYDDYDDYDYYDYYD